MDLPTLCFICNNSIVTGRIELLTDKQEKLLQFLCNFFKLPVKLSGVPDNEFCYMCEAKLNGAARKLEEIRSLETECEQIKADLWKSMVSSYESFQENVSQLEEKINPVVTTSTKTDLLSPVAVRKTFIQCLSGCQVTMERLKVERGKSQLIPETDDHFSVDVDTDFDGAGNDDDVNYSSSDLPDSSSGDEEFTLNAAPKKRVKKVKKVTQVNQDKPRKSYECRHCKEQFPFLRELRDHLSIVHNEDFHSTCRYCSFDFKAQCEQQQQQENSPSAVNMLEPALLYRCGLNGCNRVYKTISKLRTHHLLKCPENPKVQQRNRKSFRCDQCGKDYLNRINLRYHIASVHEKNFKFCCEICGDGFQVPCQLKAHMKKHSAEKTLECKVCGKKFKRGHQLFYHRRVHTGEMPYICEICGKGFREPARMKRHMQEVHGDEIYPCDICGKKFRSKGYVYNHVMASHHGMWRSRNKTSMTIQADESRKDGMVTEVTGAAEGESTDSFDKCSAVYYSM